MSFSRSYFNKSTASREHILTSSKNDEVPIPPHLRRALALLKVQNIQGLQKHFLSAEPFLKPWAVFRDSMFVSHPKELSRATMVVKDVNEDQVTVGTHTEAITRTHILWFYNQFDEGFLRYDARADENDPEYQPDSNFIGIINKGDWRAAEHEKLLYASLLQEFKVGKMINPWGFEYFEGKNICSAWEEVFVPIIDFVRASYSTKGCKHYGPVALMIESICPSRLAFPEGNVNMPEGKLISPTPIRLVSRPRAPTIEPTFPQSFPPYTSKFKEHMDESPSTYRHMGLTKKNIDETEKELRALYPGYGSVVDRPNFKIKMDEWVAEQRRRADWKQAESKKKLKAQASRGDVRQGAGNVTEQQATYGVGTIKRLSDTLRHSLSSTFTKKSPKEEHFNLPHRVTSHDELYEDVPNTPSLPTTMQFRNPYLPTRPGGSGPAPTVPLPRSPINKALPALPSKEGRPSLCRPGPSSWQTSEQTVYDTVRGSNPFSEHSSASTPNAFQVDYSAGGLPFSPMSQPENVPSPLRFRSKPAYNTKNSSEETLFFHPKKDDPSVLTTSASAAYGTKISTKQPEEIHKRNAASPTGTIRHWQTLGQDPKNIHPALRNTAQLYVPVEQPSRESPPKAVPWPGTEDSDDGLSPFKYDEDENLRSALSRGHVSTRRSGHERKQAQDLSHVISKENIRAALSASSQESLETFPMAPKPKSLRSIGSTLADHPNYKDGKLQTYNTHMFPRRAPANRRANRDFTIPPPEALAEASGDKTGYEGGDEEEKHTPANRGAASRRANRDFTIPPPAAYAEASGSKTGYEGGDEYEMETFADKRKEY